MCLLEPLPDHGDKHRPREDEVERQQRCESTLYWFDPTSQKLRLRWRWLDSMFVKKHKKEPAFSSFSRTNAAVHIKRSTPHWFTWCLLLLEYEYSYVTTAVGGWRVFVLLARVASRAPDKLTCSTACQNASGIDNLFIETFSRPDLYMPQTPFHWSTSILNQ